MNDFSLYQRWVAAAVGLACMVLPAAMASAARGATANPPKATSAPADSVEAILRQIPVDLMPDGAMTTEEGEALKKWAAKNLAGAPIAAEVTLDEAEGGPDAGVLVCTVPSQLSINGRKVSCRIRAVYSKKDQVESALDAGSDTLISIVGKLAAIDPLVPEKGTVKDGTLKIEVSGWTKSYAFLRLSVKLDSVSVREDAPAVRSQAGAKPPAKATPPPPAPVSPPAPSKQPEADKPAPQPAQKTTEFFGTPAYGKRVIFVVDRSGSMTDSIDCVKHELKRSIGALAEDKEFHVFFYSSGPPLEMPTRQPIKATAENKQKAYTFIDGVKPQGETDPSTAFKRAFECNPEEVYFLTDGEFDRETVGLVKGLNDKASRVVGEGKVRVHTIGFLYKSGEALLKKIAEQNGGQYKFVSEADLAQPENKKAR